MEKNQIQSPYGVLVLAARQERMAKGAMMDNPLVERYRKDYMTRKEVAEFLGRTQRTVSNMTLRGDLQAHKMPSTGRKHWFLREEVERFSRPRPVEVGQASK